MSVPAAQESQAPAEGARKSPPVLVLALGLATLLTLMLLAFATPALKSGPKSLPLAVSGPHQAVAGLEKQMDAKKPGAFDFKEYANESDGRTAIRNRDAIGGIAVTRQGVEIQTATAAGSPYAPMLKGIGAGIAESGKKVTYSEVAPFPKGDSTGSAMTILPLPLTFGGMITAVVLSLVYRGRYRHKLTGVVAVAGIVGLVGIAIVHYGFSALDGNYFAEAAALALGIAAISLVALGLVRVMGMAGLGVVAAILIFCANPLSGIATGPQWLPHPWGTIGQFLPIGATGTVMRSVAYFGGNGATREWIVLAAWVLVGILLMGFGKHKQRYVGRHEHHSAA